MKQTVIKYGPYSGISILALFSISFLTMQKLSMSLQEIFGYISMFVSLSFVFFGVRNYRDKKSSGHIKFSKALGLGMLITLVPAVFFGIFDVIYVVHINPKFLDQYYAEMATTLAEEFSADQLQAEKYFRHLYYPSF